MKRPQTCAALVPPPPEPPKRGVATASPDPSPDPRHSGNIVFIRCGSRVVAPRKVPLNPLSEFLQSVRQQLGPVVWPQSSEVAGGVMVTMGLLALLTSYMAGLTFFFEFLSRRLLHP